MKSKYVVYEVWTRARVVEGRPSEENAPAPIEGMHLCNWHIVEVPAEDTPNLGPGELF